MAAEVTRPRPEQFLDLIRRQERGRLKVYLGSAAGVGKTYTVVDPVLPSVRYDGRCSL
jgi:two-component system, OmpR family, sensor histidine kinase KdpD